MKSKIQNSKLKIVVVLLLTITLTGCDAFVRKFTRKPQGPVVAPPMVLVPEEYKNKMSKEQIYRQYYTFWKSWQTELWTSLEEHRSQKKKLDCAAQAIKNLEQMKAMLDDKKQAELDNYIQEMQKAKDRIDSDMAGYNDFYIRDKVDMIMMSIVRKFEYPKVKKNLI